VALLIRKSTVAKFGNRFEPIGSTGDLNGNGLDDLLIDFGQSYGVWLHTLGPEAITLGQLH
jgi:hypothetical protein